MNKRRHDMSEIYHPSKVNAREFVQELQESFEGFIRNMSSLNIVDDKLYIEEWYEIFARWTEIMSEGFDPFIEESGN